MKKSEDFFQKVYDLVRLIPSGRLTSYGAIARCLGSPQSSRMVGWAMNQCHTSPYYIPAHRVVNRVGLLTGKHHFDGSSLVPELLENEGAIIDENRIVNMEDMFWDPLEELGL